MYEIDDYEEALIRRVQISGTLCAILWSISVLAFVSIIFPIPLPVLFIEKAYWILGTSLLIMLPLGMIAQLGLWDIKKIKQGVRKGYSDEEE